MLIKDLQYMMELWRRACFILIFQFFQGIICDEIRLDQTEPQIKRPGETFKISCKVSGFSMTSYYMHWIRQKPGKPLEWIGSINSGTRYYSEALKDQFIMTEDISLSTQYLQAKSLRAEDTAVYYCARSPSGGWAFDYWGKGTMVTVTNASPSPPQSIFPMFGCGAASGGFYTVACLAHGFSPAESVTFKWKNHAGAQMTDFIQYPAIQKDGTYSRVSQLRVPEKDWEDKKSFICLAEHPSGEKQATLEKKEVRVQLPSLYVMTPSQDEININGTATFACLASEFSPATHTFKWQLNDVDKPETYSYASHDENNHTATSFFRIPASEWVSNTKVKCVFDLGQHGQQIKEVELLDSDCRQDPVAIRIIPPSEEDLLVNKSGYITCNISGNIKGVIQAELMAGGKTLVSKNESNGGYYIERAKIKYSEWRNWSDYTCSVKHDSFPTGKKDVTFYNYDLGEKNCHKPTIYLLPPPEQIYSDTVTLTCYVKDFSPKQLFVSWLANDKVVNDDDYLRSTATPYKTGEDRFSTYSQLTFKRHLWEADDVVFSCVVYHESSKATVTTMTRSIDNVSQKPSFVSLSLNMPQTCPPSLYLMTPLPDEIQFNKTATFACVAREFSPAKHSFKWTKGGVEIEKSSVCHYEVNGSLTTAISHIQINVDKTADFGTISCEFQHESGYLSKKVTYAREAEQTFQPRIELELPQFKSIMAYESATATCVAFAPYDVKVMWDVDGEIKEPHVTLNDPSVSRTISNLTLTRDYWKRVKTVTCKVVHPFNNAEQTSSMNAPELGPVNIRRYLSDSMQKENLVLECMITNLSPTASEISVTLQVNERDLQQPQYLSLPPSKDLPMTSVKFIVPLKPRSDGRFSCKVDDLSGSPKSSNSLSDLFAVPTLEILLMPDSDPPKLMCLATGFSPTLSWQHTQTEEIRMEDNGRITVISNAEVIKKAWEKGDSFSCEVADLEKVMRKSISICSVAPNSKVGDVFLIGPSLSDKLKTDTVTLTCLVVGISAESVRIHWTVEGQDQTNGVNEPFVSEHSNGTRSVRSLFHLPVERWDSFQTISCKVKAACGSSSERHISKAKDAKQPAVEIRLPSDADLTNSDFATLLCLISDFAPSDVLVRWEFNGTSVSDALCFNSPAFHSASKLTYALHSSLRLPKSRWWDGSYSCVVTHESSDEPLSATVEHVFAPAKPAKPSVTLLQGSNELLCLVWDFSPKAVNITWLHNKKIIETHRDSDPSKGLDGKYTVLSYLKLAAESWEIGDEYMCTVTHVAGSVSASVSREESMSSLRFLDESTNDVLPEDMEDDNWNMAFAFLTFFLLTLIYSCSITLLKVKKKKDSLVADY
ncbi:uncharacterized protein LOC114793774 [Denticeps clupeoides]|uniref:uncharacterized protein LOC114793774 n=1 Tax=Denticeps clupeoides TaxID=299321 RepID=UPI0010A2F496|nr:uncharacterized protein LOC114793774 [Denticeps clupeoides]